MRVINAMIAANKANIDLAVEDRDRDRPRRPRHPRRRADQREPEGHRRAQPRAWAGTTIDAVAKDGIQLKVKARVTVRTNIKQPRRRRHRGDDHRPRRRGHRHRDRLGRRLQGRAGEPRPHLQGRARTRASTRTRRSRSSRSTSPTSTSARTSAPSSRPTRPSRTSAASRPRPRSAARWPSPRSRRTSPRWPRTAPLVVLAEAEIPQAMAEAFRSGNLGVMDYYSMRNVQADTNMREAIARPGDGNKA